MILEMVLAVVHISAVLALVVFLSSQIALCRAQWWNHCVLIRMIRLNDLCWGSAAVVILTGFARALWGAKTWGFYSTQPIFWLKLIAFVCVTGMAIRTTRTLNHWRLGAVPSALDIQTLHRWMMVQAHFIILFPILGLMMVYGVGVV